MKMRLGKKKHQNISRKKFVEFISGQEKTKQKTKLKKQTRNACHRQPAHPTTQANKLFLCACIQSSKDMESHHKDQIETFFIHSVLFLSEQVLLILSKAEFVTQNLNANDLNTKSLIPQTVLIILILFYKSLMMPRAT